MVASHLLGAGLALGAALAWGVGNIAGATATRRRGLARVLALSAAAGTVAGLAASALLGEAAPGGRDVLWSGAAGLSVTLGLGMLYFGISYGPTAVVAPTAGVVGAALPVAFTFATVGAPDPVTIAGLVLGVAGIALVSTGARGAVPDLRHGLLPGVLSGTGFAGFFIAIGQVGPGLVFVPMAIVKSVTLAAAVGYLLLRPPRKARSSAAGTALALLAGSLDAAGNFAFVAAKQLTRLDLATVLCSMYGAITVVLAWLMFRQRISVFQWAGVAVCALAVGLIVV